MAEENRWEKLREIIREENERLEMRLLTALGKAKNKVEFVNGKWLGITDQLLAAWTAAYPAVDIQAELSKATAWILSNPTMAPRSQFSRFLLTWFSRTQDRSAIRAIPTRNDPPLIPISKRPCAYCGKTNNGVVNNIPHCAEHSRDAMDQRPVRAA